MNKDTSKSTDFDGFEPMPKQFMVWNRKNKEWLDRAGTNIFDFFHDFHFLAYNHENLVVCQSTNLFDKDGNEIFEGSIIEHEKWVGVVRQIRGQWIVDYKQITPSGVWHSLYDIHGSAKVIGHVLSDGGML